MNGVAIDDEQRGREVRPDEQRHPPEGHPRRAHRDDRDEEVERGQDRRGAGPLDAHVEEHLAESAARTRAARSSSNRSRTRRRERGSCRGTSRRRSAGTRTRARSGAGTPCPARRASAAPRSCARPANAGMMNTKIISAACMETRPLNVCVSMNCIPGCASSARKIIAIRPPSDEEDERRREVLDADHLVVGVDLEVVLPGVGAVAGVVLGPGRAPRDPVEPVVERAEAEQEADRAPSPVPPTRTMISQS